MAKTSHRIFALVGALLFLGTSMALTVAVVWQIHSSNRQTNSAATKTAATDCALGQAAGTSEAEPAVFTVKGKVSKLVVTDLTPGTGAQTKAGDCLSVKYVGSLAQSGKKFDADYTMTSVLRFKVGVGGVIPGWDQGLIGMKVGGTRRLVIPAALAYRDQSSPQIPANSDLVFTVKLLAIQ